MSSALKPVDRARFFIGMILVMLIVLALVSVGYSSVLADDGDDGPSAAATINIDIFVGGDYAEFWWDSSEIPGCTSVEIKRDSEEPKTAPCSTQPWRDDGLQADIEYHYVFSFKFADDSETSVGLTLIAGRYDGILHTSATIDESLPGYNITVAENASLTVQASTTIKNITLEKRASLSIPGNATVNTIIVAENASAIIQGTVVLQNLINVGLNGMLTIQSGATVTGGTIYDDVDRASGSCSATPGRVVASNATLNGTEFNLCSGTSILQDNTGSAKVYLFTPAKVSGNELASVYVLSESSSPIQIQDNVFTDGGIHIQGTSNVHISGCEFHGGTSTQAWTVYFRDDSRGIVEKSIFKTTTKYPIQLATSQGVTVQNNEVKLDNSDSSSAAIFIDPQTNTVAADYTVAYNTIVGFDAGIGLYLYGMTGSGSATLSAEGNTISRFEYGLFMQRSSSNTPTYTAQIKNNSIVNSTKDAVYSNLTGLQDHVTATNNCFADNQEYAVRCYTTNEVDARGNYWGHETGPSVNSNPDGRGEGVYCAKIDVADWLTDHSCTVSGLTIDGIEAVQTVQTIDNHGVISRGQADSSSSLSRCRIRFGYCSGRTDRLP